MEDRDAPIIEAVRAGDFDAVLILLEAGADPNVRDLLGETALFEATAVGNVDMAVALLLAGADPCIQSTGGAMAQDMAESPVIKSLLETFSDLDEDEAATHAAAHKLLDPVVLRKVKACMKGRAGEESGHQEALAASPSVRVQEESGHQEAAAASPSERAPQEESAEKAFEDDADLVHLLEEEPLLVAVREGSLTTVKDLLKQRANPNSLDLLGETPLYEATACGNVRIAAVLLLAGADPCHVSPRDSRAVDLAAEKPMRELLQFAAGTKSASDAKQYNLVLNELDEAMQAPMVLYLTSRSNGASVHQAVEIASSGERLAATAAKPDTPCSGKLPSSGRPGVAAAKAASGPTRVTQAGGSSQADGDAAVKKQVLGMKSGFLDAGAGRSALNDQRSAEPPPREAAPVRTDAKATLRQPPYVSAAGTKAKDLATSDDDESDEDVAMLYGKSKSQDPLTPEVAADIKVVAKKAVGEQEVTISCRSNSTFGELKHLLAEQIGCRDQLSRIWLVHKGSSGVYASYKESEKVGAVREVLFLAPSLADS